MVTSQKLAIARQVYYLPTLIIPRIRQHRNLSNYLDTHRCRKIILGAGKHARPGWLSTDGFRVSPGACYLDITKPFPLADRTVDYYFCEHVIEHVPYEQGVYALSEIFRTLKRQGKLRLATPDMDKIIALKQTTLSPLEADYIGWSNRNRRTPPQHLSNPCFAINRMFNDFGHEFVYDRGTLSAVLEQVGFQVTGFWAPGLSDDPELCGLEHHGEEIGHDNNLVETMVVEAVKH